MTTRLPVELLENILIEAATQQLDTNPRGAAELQLVSREVCEWLRPTLFFVLVVRYSPWPARNTPSVGFFHHLLMYPPATARAHVRHLVIITSPNHTARVTFPLLLRPWSLDSVAFEGESNWPAKLNTLRLRPRRVFLHPSTPDGLCDFLSAHWKSWSSSWEAHDGLDEFHVGWPAQNAMIAPTELRGSSAEHSRQELMGNVEDLVPHSLIKPLTQRTIIIELGFLADSDIAHVLQLLHLLFIGPALRVVLVLICQMTATNTPVLSRTHKSLCVALKFHFDGWIISTRLAFVLNNCTVRPQTGEEYARAARGGREGSIKFGTISLDDALALRNVW